MVRALRHTLSRARREEDGAFLIEIMVSALLLILLTGGVMMSFDVASQQSGHQRSQAIAANVAQSEIDRLRSLKFADVVGLDLTQESEVDGTIYTIDSRSEAALAPSPSGSGCNTSARSPEALKISVTVSWPAMGNRKPVSVASLVAAPSEGDASRGSFVVQIVNREGYGVDGIAVQLAGASNVTGTTDANGCVRFTDLIPQANYRLKFSRANWFTTPDNRNAVDDAVDVVAAQTGTKTYQYDPGGRLRVQPFFKRFSGTNTSSAVDSTEHPTLQPALTWEHASLGSPVIKRPSPLAELIESDDVYPDQSAAYTVYAGSCTAARPTPTPESMQPSALKRLQVPSLDVVARNTGTAYLYGITACTDWNASPAELLAGAIGPRALEPDDRRNGPGWMRLKDAGWPWGQQTAVCIRRKGGDRQFRLRLGIDHRPNNGAKSTIVDLGNFDGGVPGDVSRGYDQATTLCGQNVGFNVDNTMP